MKVCDYCATCCTQIISLFHKCYLTRVYYYYLFFAISLLFYKLYFFLMSLIRKHVQGLVGLFLKLKKIIQRTLFLPISIHVD